MSYYGYFKFIVYYCCNLPRSDGYNLICIGIREMRKFYLEIQVTSYQEPN